MPTSQAIFDDMRQTITETLVTDWSSYISSVSTAYDTAYTSIKTQLGDVQAEIIEHQKAQQALMVGVLTIVTGGVVGVFAEGLAKRIPLASSVERLETTVTNTEDALIEVTKVAEKDSVLFKVLSDTTKDAVKKGGDKLTEIGLDKFKGEAPSSGFSPEGLSVASYRDALTQGINARAKILLVFARLLARNADAFSPDLADAIRQGMYTNEFFTQKYHADAKLLAEKAELALWCAWALPRDVDYWTRVDALAKAGVDAYGIDTEALDFAKVRNRLVYLGVPEDAVTINGYRPGFWKSKAVKGLDVIGLMNWVKKGDVVHTLYEGIPIAGGDSNHWAKKKMHEVLVQSDTAA